MTAKELKEALANVPDDAEKCYGMLISAISIAIENDEFNEKYLDR